MWVHISDETWDLANESPFSWCLCLLACLQHQLSFFFFFFTFWNNKIFLSPLVLFCPHPEVSPFCLGAPVPFVENDIQKPSRFCFPLWLMPSTGAPETLVLSTEESVLGNDCLYGELREGWLCSRPYKSPGLLSFIPVNKLSSACLLQGRLWATTGKTESGHRAGPWEAFVQVQRI